MKRIIEDASERKNEGIIMKLPLRRVGIQSRALVEGLGWRRVRMIEILWSFIECQVCISKLCSKCSLLIWKA